jgi:hypothetical protein
MIDPANPAGTPVQGPIYNPMMPVGQNEEEELGDNAQVLSPATSFASIDKQFAVLIKELTQSLSSLEKQLMQALRQINPAVAARLLSKPHLHRTPEQNVAATGQSYLKLLAGLKSIRSSSAPSSIKSRDSRRTLSPRLEPWD